MRVLLARKGRWIAFAGLAFLAGCATRSLPKPTEMTSPGPICGNTGRYMCPYTQDGVLAEWVDKAINAKIGEAIGALTGAKAGHEIAKKANKKKKNKKESLWAGLLGAEIGRAVGRHVAIEMSGGWDYIKETSDVSFNSVDEMAVYLYAKHSSHEHYRDALDATFVIYPELKKRYSSAVRRAPRKDEAREEAKKEEGAAP